LACSLILAGLAGCGSSIELGQVEGTVKSGGQPLANVLVTFIPESNGTAGSVRSMGMTDAEGRFRLQTEKLQPGAVVGPHRVILEDMAIYSAPRSADGTVLAHPPQRFLPAYADPLQTPLQVDVVAGSQSVPLDLDTSSRGGD
jgi:hypothetical protein